MIITMSAFPSINISHGHPSGTTNIDGDAITDLDNLPIPRELIKKIAKEKRRWNSIKTHMESSFWPCIDKPEYRPMTGTHTEVDSETISNPHPVKK